MAADNEVVLIGGMAPKQNLRLEIFDRFFILCIYANEFSQKKKIHFPVRNPNCHRQQRKHVRKVDF